MKALNAALAIRLALFAAAPMFGLLVPEAEGHGLAVPWLLAENLDDNGIYTSLDAPTRIRNLGPIVVSVTALNVDGTAPYTLQRIALGNVNGQVFAEVMPRVELLPQAHLANELRRRLGAVQPKNVTANDELRLAASIHGQRFVRHFEISEEQLQSSTSNDGTMMICADMAFTSEKGTTTQLRCLVLTLLPPLPNGKEPRDYWRVDPATNDLVPQPIGADGCPPPHCVSDEPRWFAGDQHLHSFYSIDTALPFEGHSQDSIEQFGLAARACGLSWIIMTDHSNVSGIGLHHLGWDHGVEWYYTEEQFNSATAAAALFTAQYNQDFVFLYSQEMGAHAQAWYKPQPVHLLVYPDGVASTHYIQNSCQSADPWHHQNCESYDTIRERVEAQNGLMFIAHPYKGQDSGEFTFEVWDLWGSATGFAGLELWSESEGDLTPEDEQAISKWEQLLYDTGMPVDGSLPSRPDYPNPFPVGLGNSDAHSAARVGNTFTYCWMQQDEMPTHGEISDALKAGHCVVSNGPLVYATLGGARIGEVARIDQTLATFDLQIELRSTTEFGDLSNFRLFAVLDGIHKLEIPIASGLSKRVTWTLPLTLLDKFIYLRLDQRFGGKYHAITNPIWVEYVEPTTYTLIAAAGAHGTVTPSGTSTVSGGSNVTFTATPESGYQVDNWWLDNGSSPAQVGGNTYTLQNIQDDHWVTVLFKGGAPPAGEFEVLAPNGGETFVLEGEMRIRWRSESLTGPVRIDLYKGGVLNHVIDASTPNNGDAGWDVPYDQTIGSGYRVRVTHLGSSVFDESDGVFQIIEDLGLPEWIDIDDVYDLQAICSDSLHPCDGKYRLVADIEAIETDDWNCPSAGRCLGFRPIGIEGSTDTLFRGVLDGQGHRISNLWIDRPTEDNVGLFRQLRYPGVIKNLILDGNHSRVVGSEIVGALVGYVSSGEVLNCASRINRVEGVNTVGGLVGKHYNGFIKDSSAMVDWVEAEEGNIVGGLVGDCGGGSGGFANIERCVAQCAMVRGDDRVGGIAGRNEDRIVQCYTEPHPLQPNSVVDGNDNWTGGIVGENYGSISDCYVINRVQGDGSVTGGITGHNTGTVERCYVAVLVTPLSQAGGLIGHHYGSVDSSVWDVLLTQIPANRPVGLGGGTISDCYGLPTATMKQKQTYDSLGWNFANTWWIEDGLDYPKLCGVGDPLAAPTNLNAISGQGVGVVLQWDAVAYEGECGPFYRVYRADSVDGVKQPLGNAQVEHSFLDATAVPQVTYFYWVKAAATTANVEGYTVLDARESALSNATSGWRDFPPLAVPMGVSASDGLVGFVAISWDAVAGAGVYRVHRADVDSSGLATPLSGWVKSGPYVDAVTEWNEDYFYWVTAAVDDQGARESDFGGADTGYARQPCDSHAECDNEAFCDGLETCDGGVCTNGTPPCGDMAHCDDGGDRCICIEDGECEDGLGCTMESCHSNGICVQSVSAGQCAIGGACYAADESKPASACLVCDPTVTQSDWTPAWSGTPCGSSADSECDNPDTCDDSGHCLPNHEPAGMSCEDGVFCNGAETCQVGYCLAITPPCVAGMLCNESANTCGFDCNSNGIVDGLEIILPGDFNGNGVFDIADYGRTAECVTGPCPSSSGCSQSLYLPESCCTLADSDHDGDIDLRDLARVIELVRRPCGTQSECDDGAYCNGLEVCVEGFCDSGAEPCLDPAHPLCDEATGSCLPDCNLNDAADGLDIMGGTSMDCNNNGIPDECDVAAAFSGDCNANIVPDECEVSAAPRLFVANRDGDNVVMLDGLTGAFLGQILPPGEYGLDYANGITVGTDNTLYVASVRTHEILNVDPHTGELIRRLSAPSMRGPVDLLDDGNGHLLVACWGTDSVVEFDLASGTFVRDLVTSSLGGLDGPGGLAVTTFGVLLVSSQNTNEILTYDLIAGTFMGVWASGCGLNGPADMVVRDDGSVLVASFYSDSVVHVSASGACLGALVTSGTGGLSGAEGLAISDGSTLLVTSRSTNAIHRYDLATGQFLGILSAHQSLNAPTYMAYGSVSVDCNANGVPDDCDIAGDSVDTNSNGVPDECEANASCQWQWAALDGGMDDHVLALTVIDDGSSAALYAGGTFRTAGGVATNYIAKWDGATWSALGSGANSWVYALAGFDDGGGVDLYAGGRFTTSGGVQTNCIAKWDGWTWSTLGVGMAGVPPSVYVGGLAVFQDGTGAALYAGGQFLSADGVTVNHIARWDGSSWSSLGSGMEGGGTTLVVSLHSSSSFLYVGGNFLTAGGVSANRIAKWDGSGWSPMGGGLPLWPNALTMFDDGSGSALYAGGYFTSADGVSANRVAKWDGTTWSPLGSGMNERVLALAVFDDGSGPALYAGGWFTVAGGDFANHIAKWDGSTWSPLGSGTDDIVNALAVFDDGTGPALYAGGRFLTAGGTPTNRIAKWHCPHVHPSP